MRILIVEDDIDSGEALTLFLADVGYEVQLALTPLQALAVASEFKPHLAILDIGLPGMSGFELVARLRVLPELDGCSFFSMSAYAGIDVARRSAQAGFQHHFSKPLVVRDLLARLASVGANLAFPEPNAVPSALAPALQRVPAWNR